MIDTTDTKADWGPFGRPLFNDASSRALSRVGVVDVGSNSVRLVVFDGAARSPAYFYNEKVMCALGTGLSESGVLYPLGRERALSAIKRFQHLADGMGIAPLTAVATAAVREARDGPDFCEQVLREIGLKIHVIDGEEEARLSAQGVLLGWPGSYGLVCDIGGSSLELAEIQDGQVGKRITSALGPLKLADVKGGRKGRKAYIQGIVKDLHGFMGEQRDRLFLVGGSWRAIARIDMERRGYPLHVLHEYRITPREISKTINFIRENDTDELRARCGISSARMALVPLACEVLKEIVRSFRPHDIAVSSYGIREGMLYEQMPDALRNRDPLIESCYFAENQDARLPGFGRKLYKFVQPIFRHRPHEYQRLVKAACLLHDVSWRAHPDFRSEVCFDYATRANMGGLRHRERAFLGYALMNRYSGTPNLGRHAAIVGLLKDRDCHYATVLGKAMRLGAMLWLEPDTKIGHLEWFPKKKHLHLHLPPEAQSLFGEVAFSRFKSLASTLEAEPQVFINKKPLAI